MGTSGFLIPDAPALVRPRGAGVDVDDIGLGRRFRAEGIFGAALMEFFINGVRSPVLAALAADHPLVLFLDRVAGAAVLPLKPAAAIELGGFDTLFLELLGRCNERCQHCYAGSAPEIQGALEVELCDAIVDDAAALGFRRVQFTGGDPLLCGFLPELVARARARGIEAVEIYTNGLALSDRLLDRLEPHRPSFAFSFYSHDAAHHDAITQTPGSQSRTLAAIDRVVSRDLPARVSMVVMAENAGDQDATVELLRARGVQQIAVTGSYEVGRGEQFVGDLLRVGQQAHRGVRSVDSSVESADQVAAASSPRYGSLCVTYDGQVVPCIFSRDNVLGRIRERSLIEIARAPELPPRRIMSYEAMMESCRERLSCPTCRLTACALQLMPAGAGDTQ